MSTLNAKPSETRWTEAQERGIKTIDTSLLLSAAAGSGKTSVLAARCAHMVCDADERCSVDSLLVVTFTRDAAGEMRARIEKTLLNRLRDAEHPDLMRELALIDRANISTIHAFCIAVLKQHFHVLGLDPDFTILGENETRLLRSDVARELLSRRYEEPSAVAFRKLVDEYGNGDDNLIQRRMLNLHAMMSSLIDPDAWMNSAMSRLQEAATMPFIRSALGRELIELLVDRLTATKRRLVQLVERCAAIIGLEPYVEHLAEIIDAVQLWLELAIAGDLKTLAAMRAEWSPARLPTIRQPPPEKAAIQSQIDAIKKLLKDGGELGEWCRFSSDQWRDGVAATLPASAELLTLTRMFAGEFEAAKREMRCLDFGDLERLTLSILRDPSGATLLTPTEIARTYHSRFSHVLVDEYQDINEVQDAILKLVSRECVASEPGVRTNLFCVGDVKQSIYRFRLAEPQRFLQRYQQFRQDGAAGRVIDLQTNFRSRREVLSTLNGLFGKLITKETADVDYDDTQRLHPPESTPYDAFKMTGDAVELHVLPAITASSVAASESEPPSDPEAEEADDLDRTEREAVFVAHRIRELLGRGASPAMHVVEQLNGSDVSRPLKMADVAILLRSPKKKARAFVDVLRSQGLSVHTDAASGFFESIEIRDMLALLALLDNRQQDIHLAAVLRGPIAALEHPEDAMAAIRLASPDSAVPYWQCVANYVASHQDSLAQQLQLLLSRLDRWRDLARQRALAEVIWTIYQEAGILTFAGGLVDGRQRVANLLSLHEHAQLFGTFQRQGLRRFLQFLDDLKDEDVDLEQRSFSSLADDAVRLMSIHKSKGLEFPVVFVVDLGKKHNFSDTAGRIVVDRAAFLGLDVVDMNREGYYPSLASVLVRDRIRRQSVAEELRVLYVAATRAKEKLILVGTSRKENNLDEWRDRWGEHEGALPADEIHTGSSFLAWLGPASTAIKYDDGVSLSLHEYTADETKRWTVPRSARSNSDGLRDYVKLIPLKPAPPLDDAAQAAIDRLTSKYDFQLFTQIAAAQSVSSLTKHGRTAPVGYETRGEAQTSFDKLLRPPLCAAMTRELSPTDIGSATHVVLEHLNYQSLCDSADIMRQIDRLVDKRLISTEFAKGVDVDAIAWMMSTPVGKLIRENVNILKREMSVYFARSPEYFDPLAASSDQNDQVMIRSRLDLVIPRPSGTVLIDYKTDRVMPETVDARAQFYNGQMLAYAEAATAMLGTPVTESYLVFLHPRVIVRVAAIDD